MAVLESVPDNAVTWTVMVIVAEAPELSVPREAVTVPLVPTGGPEQEPTVVTQERKTVPAGSGSLSVTLAAASGPRFETTIWKVRT